MSYVPAMLRRQASYNHSPFIPQRQPLRWSHAAGICGLLPAPQRRFFAGLSHLHELGERAEAEFWLSAIDDRLDLEAVLERLDEYRGALKPETLRAVGGDRMPRRLLRAVPQAVR